MSQLVLRAVSGDELLDTAFPLNQYAFGSTPAPDNREEWQERLTYRSDRYFVVGFVDREPVATANNLNLTQNLRGWVVEAGGVAGVSVHPAHRRHGYAHQVVVNCLEKSRELNQPVSALYPFRESFYARLGYANLPQVRYAKLSPHNLKGVLRLNIPGTVELVHIQDGYEAYRAFVLDMQPRQHGMMVRTPAADRYLRDKGQYWLAVARQDGQVVGMFLYQMDSDNATLDIWRFYYRHSAGKYLMLDWLARHIDQVATIKLTLPPAVYLETWLEDLGLDIESPSVYRFSPSPMGRVVSVEGLNGLPVGAGQFTARILDEQCPWNDAAWAFTAQEGRLAVSPTPAGSADCQLSIQALSALVYGVGKPADFEWRGWGDPPPDVQATLRTMFPPCAPFFHERF